MSSQSVIYEFIRKWANLVESEDEQGRSGNDDIVCFFDGRWHDRSGNPISIPREEEGEIVRTISRIESSNYSQTPSLIMMDDSETLEDVADYLECDMEDMFIFFRRPKSRISEYKSPSSMDPELSGGIYFLASLQEYGGDGNVTWSEIADISGNMESASVFMRLLAMFSSWLREHRTRIVASSCRERTSNRFFMSPVFLRKFEQNGYVRVEEADRTEEIDGERFHLNVLADETWWNGLSGEEKEEAVDLIQTYI